MPVQLSGVSRSHHGRRHGNVVERRPCTDWRGQGREGRNGGRRGSGIRFRGIAGWIGTNTYLGAAGNQGQSSQACQPRSQEFEHLDAPSARRATARSRSTPFPARGRDPPISMPQLFRAWVSAPRRALLEAIGDSRLLPYPDRSGSLSRRSSGSGPPGRCRASGSCAEALARTPRCGRSGCSRPTRSASACGSANSHASRPLARGSGVRPRRRPGRGHRCRRGWRTCPRGRFRSSGCRCPDCGRARPGPSQAKGLSDSPLVTNRSRNPSPS